MSTLYSKGSITHNTKSVCIFDDNGSLNIISTCSPAGMNRGSYIWFPTTSISTAVNWCIGQDTAGNLCIGASNPAWMTNYHVKTYGSSGWEHGSDERIKCNINSIPKCLDQLLQLNPITYHYKKNTLCPISIGFTAQNIEKHLPHIVSDSGIEQLDEDGNKFTVKCIAITNLIPYIVKGMQEQQALIVDLQQKNNELQQKTNELELRLASIEAKLLNN